MAEKRRSYAVSTRCILLKPALTWQDRGLCEVLDALERLSGDTGGLVVPAGDRKTAISLLEDTKDAIITYQVLHLLPIVFSLALILIVSGIAWKRPSQKESQVYSKRI